MKNTTIPVQNNFSLLENEQTVLCEITKNENQNKNNSPLTYEQMDTHSNNMDTLETNVSLLNTTTKNAMHISTTPNNIISSSTNYDLAVPNNQLKHDSYTNYPINQIIKDNVPYLGLKEKPHKHVLQMSIKNSIDKQMTPPLEHEMKTKSSEDQVIKQTLAHSNDMQIENSIIALATNTPSTTDDSNATPASSLLKNHQPLQNAKNPLYPKEKTQTYSNSETAQNSKYGKYTSLSSTNEKPTNHLCPATSSTRLSASFMDIHGTTGACSLVQSPNPWSSESSSKTPIT